MPVVPQRHQDKHVVITGAGTGIGKAIALRLAAEGARLSLFARNVTRLEETAAAAKAAGSPATFLAALDIRERQAVDRTFAATSEEMGAMDVLIANSGVGGPNEAGEADRFDEIIQTNLSGTYYCLRAAQRHLSEVSANSEAAAARHLVAISSILGRFGVPGYTGYCASKTALLGLVRALALELAPLKVQVNAVCPGWVDTDMATQGIQGMADAMGVPYPVAHRTAMQMVPLGRMSTPEELAGLISWLISEDAVGVTGQGVDMNGGAYMI